MINNKILPAHILRLYCWEVLKQETSMSVIGTLIPVLPIEDEPKVADSGKPYAIYGYSENSPARGAEEIHEGVFTLRVIAPSFAELGQIMNVVSIAFESSDIATEAVNNYSSRYPNGVLEGIRFLNTRIAYLEGGEAAETEGGPVDGMVSVSYSYINRIDIPVPNSAKGGLWS